MIAPRCSIVVPVFDEAANIGVFCRRCRAELPADCEVLICYDFPGDNTLPALHALADTDKPVQLRLIHNTLGRGVRYAIEAGMRAATAPVVVVMMADLSDDFGKVATLIGRAEAGADVVCASRYMRGGRQIGGPRLKGLLSRLAGVSLHWLAGLPTHDATNSFKAYRREFLARTPIESKAGFCLGIELTVKAHFRGGRVEEVPALWTDRSAGQSRFKLFQWLPSYLHWYLWALWHAATRSIPRPRLLSAAGRKGWLTSPQQVPVGLAWNFKTNTYWVSLRHVAEGHWAAWAAWMVPESRGVHPYSAANPFPGHACRMAQTYYTSFEKSRASYEAAKTALTVGRVPKLVPK